jgi:Tol biopolymer transport system component
MKPVRRMRVAAAFALLACAGCARQASREAAFELDGDASLFLPGTVSSQYSEIRPAVSPDGTVVLWGSTNRPGGAGGWDIWMSRREESHWSAPVAVSFDSPQNDFDPAFAPDGRTVWFFSNRAGGLGGDDIWSVPFDPASSVFGTPFNAGTALNSAGDEWAPTPTPDGHGLLFATNGRGGAGRHDLFASAWRNGAWQPAQPLAGEVNGAGDDFDAAFLDSGRVLVFARSDDLENAPIALWSAVREGDRWVRAVRLDARVNVDGGWILGPADDPAHPGTLLFSGVRTGGQGLADIHSIHYRVR